MGPSHESRASRSPHVADGVEVSKRRERVRIQWTDWDRFRYRRTVDGDVVSDVRAVDGKVEVRRGKGDWAARDDIEPYRVQLQTTWSTWDEVLELFGDRVSLVEEATEQLGGREVRRHRLELGPAIPGVDDDAWTPVRLGGTVWIDAATAVRLKAEVEGAVQQGNLERQVTLSFERLPQPGAGSGGGKAKARARAKAKARSKARVNAKAKARRAARAAAAQGSDGVPAPVDEATVPVASDAAATPAEAAEAGEASVSAEASEASGPGPAQPSDPEAETDGDAVETP